MISFSLATETYGQCEQILDPQNGTPTYTPQKNFECLAAGDPANATTHTITFASAVSNITIDWGDGTVTTYAGPSATFSYTYPTTGIFNYAITQPGPCTDTIKGAFINQYNTSVPGIGFITPPAGTANKRCVPEDLTINNQSPGMNGFTQFLIDWGDNTTQMIDYTSFGQDISHTYQPDQTGCSVPIAITYQNLCGDAPGGINPSATYGEYFFLDYDTAVINPGEIILCDTATITLNDASILNCLDTTNRALKWQSIQGLSGPLPLPGENVFRDYNTPANRTLTIPSGLLWPVPPDSLYRVRLTIRNQCGDDSIEIPIRIVAPAKPDFAVVQDSTCPGAAMAFTNSTPDPSGAQIYEWNWGDGNIEINNNANVSHNYKIGGDYTVTLRSIINGYNGQVCFKQSTLNVHVLTSVTPIINVSPTEGCDTMTVRIDNNSVNTDAVVWQGWRLGGSPTITAGSSFMPTPITSDTNRAAVRSLNPADSSAVVFYKDYGRYTIVLRAQSKGCATNSDQERIFIYPSPTIRWQVSDTILCLGQTLDVRDSSRVTQTDQRALNSTWRNINWELDMGDGTVYTSATTITSNFDDVEITDRLTQHAYTAAGTYWITLRVYTPHSCQTTDSVRVVVQPVTQPNFELRRGSCNPSEITFLNTSSDTALRFHWEILRGITPHANFTTTDTTAFTYTLPYFPPGDSTAYQIRMTAVSGNYPDTCVETTAYRLIKIPPVPVASFTPSRSDGCSPINGVTFVNNSINVPAGSQFNWDFGNGNTYTGNAPPPQNYLNNGTFNQRDTIRLTIEAPGNCFYNTSKQIIVYPQANVSINAPNSVCSGTEVTFNATGNGLATYAWDFSVVDGTLSSETAPSKKLTNTGSFPITYTVRLTAATIAGCIDSASHLVQVNPVPSAGLTINPAASCGNDSVTITFDASGSSNAYYFRYNFGDGSPIFTDSNNTTTTHTYPRNNTLSARVYTAELQTISSNGCLSTPQPQNITIRPFVNAFYSANDPDGCAPHTVQFANLSVMADNNYEWQLKLIGAPGGAVPYSSNLPGNGFQFTFPNITDTVQQYAVSLVATDDNAFPICTDAYTDTITVYPSPAASFDINPITPATRCSPVTATFDPTNSRLGNRYYWNFGDGTTAKDTLATKTPVAWQYINTSSFDRTYNITLTVETPNGCQAAAQKTLDVKPLIVANFTMTDSVGCSPVDVAFQNTSNSPAISFTWLRNGIPFYFARDLPPQSFTSTSPTDTTFYNLKLVARGVGNVCSDTSPTQNIKVFPKPVVDLKLTPLSGCAPLDVAMIANGTTGGQRFEWFVRQSGQPTFSPDTVVFNSDTLVKTFFNPTGLPLIYEIKLVVYGPDGCSDSTTSAITVNPQITPDFTLMPDTAGCGPFKVTFSNSTGSPAANIFSWQINGVPLGNSATDFTYIFNNLSNTNSKFDTLTLVASSFAYGCPTAVSQVIQTYPQPRINFDTDVNPATACAPALFSFRVTDSTSVSNYNWKIENQDTLSKTNSTPVNITINNITNAPTQLFVRATGSSVYGCADSTQKIITINPYVRAGFSQSADSGCSPLKVDFNNTGSPGANRVEWFVDNVLVSQQTNFTHKFEFAGPAPTKTFNIMQVVRNNPAFACADTAYSTVVVFRKPEEDLLTAVPNNGCSPLNVSFSSTANGITQYLWNLGDGTQYDTTTAFISHTYNNLNPVANRIFNAELIVKTQKGCADTAIANISVGPLVTAGILAPDTIGCTPFTTNFSSSPSVNADVFSWNMGDGTPVQGGNTPTHTFRNLSDTNRTFNVQLIANKTGTNCADTAYKTVVVYPQPVIDFGITAFPATACAPVEFRFHVTDSVLVQNYRWLIQNQDTLTRPAASPVWITINNITNAPTQLFVRATGSSVYGCADSTQKIITINPYVRAGFSQSADSGCSPLKVDFNNTGSPGANRVEWFVDNVLVSQQTNFTHKFEFAGPAPTKTFNIMQVVRNNPAFACADTAYSTVVVFRKPEEDLLTAVPNNGCSPLNVSFSSTANGITQYLWNLGDGTQYDTTTAFISHTYNNLNPVANRIFNAELIVKTQKGCADTAIANISVGPLVTAGILAPDTIGCSPFETTLSGATSINADVFSWNMADGSATQTGVSALHSFKNYTDSIKIFNIRLIAGKIGTTCADTAYKPVVVYPEPKSEFALNTNMGCGPLNVQVTNNSFISDSSVYYFGWGGLIDTLITDSVVIDTIISNQTNNNKQVKITLEVFTQNGCRDVSSQNVLINPDVVANFSIDTAGCSPLLANIQNNSYNPTGSYLWDFGDGTGSSIPQPNHTFKYFGSTDTVYQVVLEAISAFNPGCNKKDTANLRVYAQPFGAFNIVEGGMIQLPNKRITINNQTSFRTAWNYLWTFGNGDTLTYDSATFIYDYTSIEDFFVDTNYTVTALVYSDFGCKDTIIRNLVIRPVPPVADFEPDTAGCAPLRVVFRNKTIYANRYFWSFGDGGTSSVQNPVHVYQQPGNYEVILRAYGLGGEDRLIRSDVIKVHEVPEAAFYIVPTPPRVVKIPDDIVYGFPREPVSGYTYNWDFGDGTNYFVQNPEHKYTKPGNYNIVLTVTTLDGCTDTDTVFSAVEAMLGGQLIIPNAFVPEGGGGGGGYVGPEGSNAVFYPFTEGVVDISMQIYNRWGELIFESNELNKGWDGYYRGKLCKQDVYVYKIKATFADGSVRRKVGDVTLLR